MILKQYHEAGKRGKKHQLELASLFKVDKVKISVGDKNNRFF